MELYNSAADCMADGCRRRSHAAWLAERPRSSSVVTLRRQCLTIGPKRPQSLCLRYPPRLQPPEMARGSVYCREQVHQPTAHTWTAVAATRKRHGQSRATPGFRPRSAPEWTSPYFRYDPTEKLSTPEQNACVRNGSFEGRNLDTAWALRQQPVGGTHLVPVSRHRGEELADVRPMRLEVVTPRLHYCSDIRRHELAQPPRQHHREATNHNAHALRTRPSTTLQGHDPCTPYAPVYYALPRPPDEHKIERWKSAKMLGRSRPAKCVLHYVEQLRSSRLPSRSPRSVNFPNRKNNISAAQAYHYTTRPHYSDMVLPSTVDTYGTQTTARVVSASGRVPAGSRHAPRALWSSPTACSLGFVRRRTAAEHAAAAKIQALYHGRVARRLIGNLHNSAIEIQARVRGRIARVQRMRENGAAGVIQVWCRGWRVRRQYTGILAKARALRQERAKANRMLLSTAIYLKPKMTQILGRQRERKAALHREMLYKVTLRRFRRVSKAALLQARREPAAPTPRSQRVLERTERQRLDAILEHDATELQTTLSNASGGQIRLDLKSSTSSWTLKWGNLELSKSKVAELIAEIERINEEWKGGKILRGDDGVFRACFDPGSVYRDWLAKWLDPAHYSHGGRLNRQLVPYRPWCLRPY